MFGTRRALIPVAIALACFATAASADALYQASMDGAQNLPDSWQAASFHLPRRLQENLPEIGGEPTVVLMHNDAVVQGLSELPFVDAPCRWAVLTVGTLAPAREATVTAPAGCGRVWG